MGFHETFFWVFLTGFTFGILVTGVFVAISLNIHRKTYYNEIKSKILKLDRHSVCLEDDCMCVMIEDENGDYIYLDDILEIFRKFF